MNSDILKGKWKQIKGSLRSKWGELTDHDLDKIQGDGETFIGVLQEKYGYGRERAEREMNDFLSSPSGAWNSGAPESTGGSETAETDMPAYNREREAKKRRVS